MDTNGEFRSWKIGLIIGVGIFSASLGVIFNVWVMGELFTQDGSLSTAGNIIVWCFDVVAVGFGAALIWYRVQIARRLKFNKTALIAWAIVFFILLASLEVTARIIDGIYNNNFSGERERLSTADIIPFRVFGWDQYRFEGDERLIVDSRGNTFPFEKKEGMVRIVTFGGSTTYQSAPGSSHYPRILEELLEQEYPNRDFEVINVANVGYTTAHSLTLLEFDVISWNPDLIIMSHNINDLIAGYTEHFAPDYSELFSLPEYTRGKSGTERVTRALFEWSTLYWVIDQQLIRIGVPLIKERMGLAVYNEKSYGEEPLPEAEVVFRRNIETFVDIAQNHDVHIVLGTQPFIPKREYWDRTMRFHGANYALIYPLYEEIVAHHARYNEVLKEVGREKGISVMDIASALGGEDQYFHDHVHYTKEGLEQVARTYFQGITAGDIRL